MSVSPVSLCNLALSRAGGQRIAQITSLGEASNEARQCAILYPELLRTCLRRFPWQFAAKRAHLAFIGQGNRQFLYSYQYPSDCLQARKIVSAGKETLEFTTELGPDNTRNILCNIEDAELLYTAEVTDPRVWDALFYSALAWELASELAVVLGNDSSKGKYLMDRAMLAFDEACTSDSREGQEKESVGAYLEARG